MLYFPHPLSVEEEGLLAIGGDLSADRLILAYNFGIFPWYNQEPILWWYTHPRCILRPEKIKISKSMRNVIRKQTTWNITIDQDFNQVIESCAATKREGQAGGTWITEQVKEAYTELYQRRIAHSAEVWEGDQLIGGLYGVCFGRIFFGESMFTSVPNASKYVLIFFAKFLANQGCHLIDCQQVTSHMLSMGASKMSKEEFYESIKQNLSQETISIDQASFKHWEASLKLESIIGTQYHQR